MDGFVLLTPMVILGVILLLGFTGCDKVFGLPPVELPSALSIEARVPSAFTITLVRLLWIRPGSTVNEATTDPVRTDEGTTVVLSHLVSDVTDGSWRATCRLRVKEGAAEQEDVAALDFMVDASPGSTGRVQFETTGSPSTGDFRVVAVGYVPE